MGSQGTFWEGCNFLYLILDSGYMCQNSSNWPLMIRSLYINCTSIGIKQVKMKGFSSFTVNMEKNSYPSKTLNGFASVYLSNLILCQCLSLILLTLTHLLLLSWIYETLLCMWLVSTTTINYVPMLYSASPWLSTLVIIKNAIKNKSSLFLPILTFFIFLFNTTIYCCLIHIFLCSFFNLSLPLKNRVFSAKRESLLIIVVPLGSLILCLEHRRHVFIYLSAYFNLCISFAIQQIPWCNIGQSSKIWVHFIWLTM